MYFDIWRTFRGMRHDIAVIAVKIGLNTALEVLLGGELGERKSEEKSRISPFSGADDHFISN
jgi:hypothetical protein